MILYCDHQKLKKPSYHSDHKIEVTYGYEG